MSRILKQLKEYDNSVTVGELIQKLEQEEQILAEKELKEENIKAKFENKYFKHFKKGDWLIEDELVIYKFEDFYRKERNTDWDFLYTFDCSKIHFKRSEVYNLDTDDFTFTAKDLEKMIEITEEEYNQYLEKYNRISNELKEIVNGK